MFMVYRATIHNPENFSETTYVDGITYGDSLGEGMSKVETFYADLLQQVSIRFIDENEDEEGVIEFSTIEEGMGTLFDKDENFIKESYGLTANAETCELVKKLEREEWK